MRDELLLPFARSKGNDLSTRVYSILPDTVGLSKVHLFLSASGSSASS